MMWKSWFIFILSPLSLNLFGGTKVLLADMVFGHQLSCAPGIEQVHAAEWLGYDGVSKSPMFSVEFCWIKAMKLVDQTTAYWTYSVPYVPTSGIDSESYLLVRDLQMFLMAINWASRLLYVVPWWKCKQYLLNSKVRAGRAKYRLYLFLRYCYERTPLYCYLVRGGQTTGLIEVRKMMLTVGLILRVTKVPETGETNRMKQSYVSNTCLWKKLTTCPSVHKVCTTGKMVHVFIDFMAKNLLVILSNKMERVWSKTCTWAVWLFMRSNSIKDKNRTSNRHTQCSVYLLLILSSSFVLLLIRRRVCSCTQNHFF